LSNKMIILKKEVQKFLCDFHQKINKFSGVYKEISRYLPVSRYKRPARKPAKSRQIILV